MQLHAETERNDFRDTSSFERARGRRDRVLCARSIVDRDILNDAIFRARATMQTTG